MKIEDLKSKIYEQLNFTPSSEQLNSIDLYISFFKNPSKSCYILSGFAGTGKTSLISGIVKTNKSLKVKTKLLAPTGRAAKVFSNYSNEKAYTIHKFIYRRDQKVGDNITLNLSPNLHKNTIFIVDEASMIGEYNLSKGVVSERNLLEDLFEYIYSGENCKLLIVGDRGQLPPVGSNESPALNKMYLENIFPTIQFFESNLKQIHRQNEDSLILENATSIRNQKDKYTYPKIKLDQRKDLQSITGQDLQERIESAISLYGEDEVIIITRSNKWANQYNQNYRAKILWHEEELCNNDLILNVKNNYFWLDEQSEAGFIANGEILKINRILSESFIYETRFVKALVNLVDYPSLGDFEVLLLPETLTIDGPNLSRERMKELFFEIEKDYLDERNKKKRYDSILKNPYFNALQVKYAYALTCHKSQGGQWDCVFIDAGYLNEDDINPEYFRWLYTALTRAKKQVYLINFKEEYFME